MKRRISVALGLVAITTASLLAIDSPTEAAAPPPPHRSTVERQETQLRKHLAEVAKRKAAEQAELERLKAEREKLRAREAAARAAADRLKRSAATGDVQAVAVAPLQGANRPALLACIFEIEDNDDPRKGGTGYQSNTGNGFYGGYQFDKATWNGAVRRAGYPAWVGRLASEAPAEVQDAAAWQLYTERGLQPWPTPAKRCRHLT